MEDLNSRQKILEAALNEFAEKGYEGSRVEAIAKRAKVSKALIYYNFDSKDAILQELIDEFRKDIVKFLSTTYSLAEGKSTFNRFEKHELEVGMQYILDNRQKYSILVMESLKTTPGEKRILSIWDEINHEVRNAILAQRGYQIDPMNVQRQVADFFFIFIPTLMYSIFGAEWAKENNFSITDINDKIVDIVSTVYDQFMR
jgi:AcrR family transcriptional regulator